MPSTSVSRILWDGLKKHRRASTVFTAGVAIWIVAIAVFAWGALIGHDAGLPHLAFPLLMSSWMTGGMLLQFASVIGSRSGWHTEAVEHYRRSRLRRWMTSSDPTYVDLSGNAKQRAEQTEAANEAVAPPDITIIAMPLLTALGATCFGFAGAMIIAEAYLAPRSLLLDDPALNLLYWGGVLVFMLWVSLWSVGRASLRVYRWAGDRAAAAAQALAAVRRERHRARDRNATRWRTHPDFIGDRRRRVLPANVGRG